MLPITVTLEFAISDLTRHAAAAKSAEGRNQLIAATHTLERLQRIIRSGSTRQRAAAARVAESILGTPNELRATRGSQQQSERAADTSKTCGLDGDPSRART